MDSLIKVLADSGNLAVIVLVICNGGLLWLVRSLLAAAREQVKEWTDATKAAAITDLRIAEALASLRTEIQRCSNR